MGVIGAEIPIPPIPLPVPISIILPRLAIPTILLPTFPVVEAVGGRLPILGDRGVRRGISVF
ncbi:hypothetical protein PanWU01x14_272710 [Parasponia andersonii]|uniref:Uncharacterized protein n=1 Tax=Parasponia andersonii TaxID=3476 RepID=A0A2P5B450_PARAD|nr:hypothetical protein PanWU01x14_272710 [Parasponia andersonii]